MDQQLRTFIQGMPKIELHIHIEGTLEPELMLTLARLNGVPLPYQDVDQLRQAYQFGNLQDFLDLYYQGMSVLTTEQDFYDLTCAYLKRVASQNVTHAEIFFDPQGHTQRGIAFETVINGITRALRDGEAEFGITTKLILCFLRHLSEDDAFDTLEQARPHLDRIDGFGLDSSEKGHPPSKFARVFAAARKTGLRLVAHAGEEGPAEYVREALDLLKVHRVDHGNRSLEDPSLVNRLVKQQMGLTVCPVCNVKLRGVADMRQHPLKTMLRQGIKATVNSDDPAYFDAYITENFLAVADALSLTRDEIATLARNAIEISFLSPQEKEEQALRLDDYVADFAPFPETAGP